MKIALNEREKCIIKVFSPPFSFAQRIEAKLIFNVVAMMHYYTSYMKLNQFVHGGGRMKLLTIINKNKTEGKIIQAHK